MKGILLPSQMMSVSQLQLLRSRLDRIMSVQRIRNRGIAVTMVNGIVHGVVYIYFIPQKAWIRVGQPEIAFPAITLQAPAVSDKPRTVDVRSARSEIFFGKAVIPAHEHDGMIREICFRAVNRILVSSRSFLKVLGNLDISGLPSYSERILSDWILPHDQVRILLLP